jgi:hypothetical protein
MLALAGIFVKGGFVREDLQKAENQAREAQIETA